MAKEPAYIRALREYANDWMTSLDFPAHQDELWSASDRAFALLHSINVENALHRLFEAKLRQGLNSTDRKRLYGSEGILSNFSSKIALAYALELIGPVTRDDLNLIRFIRNTFAHSRRPLSFDLQVVGDACAHLQFPDRPHGYKFLGPGGREADGDHADLTNAKTRYRLTCQRIEMGISNLLHPPPDIVLKEGWLDEPLV